MHRNSFFTKENVVSMLGGLFCLAIIFISILIQKQSALRDGSRLALWPTFSQIWATIFKKQRTVFSRTLYIGVGNLIATIFVYEAPPPPWSRGLLQPQVMQMGTRRLCIHAGAQSGFCILCCILVYWIHRFPYVDYRERKSENVAWGGSKPFVKCR